MLSAEGETWSVTFKGHRFYYGPSLETSIVDPEDVAHHLGQINRYGGATKWPFSVAQHSINVAAGLWRDTQSAVLALDGLVHDAHEYVGAGDVISPVKKCLEGLKPFEARIDAHIRSAWAPYGVLAKQADICRTYDMRALKDEAPALLKTDVEVWALPKGITAIGHGVDMDRWDSEHAADMWLKLFDSLTKLIRNKRIGRNLAPPRLVPAT